MTKADVIAHIRGMVGVTHDPHGVAVTAAIAERAVAVIEALPNDLPLPEVEADPDGCLSLDWLGETRTISLGVGKSDRYPCAWWSSDASGYGVATLDEVPELVRYHAVQVNMLTTETEKA